jgi:hypothetical protein
MSEIVLSGAFLGTPLEQLLMCDGIVPGADAGYTVCKVIYSYHPLGAKIVEAPISMAQSQVRKLSIPGAPEDRLKLAFQREWKALGVDRLIFNLKRISRIYGIGSLALMPEEGKSPNSTVKFEELYKQTELNFNVFDPLNTSGSLVLNQQPNDPSFLKVPASFSVAGQPYHQNRTVVVMNEEPIYLEYTNSAYGYVGRSVYQRALYMLQSFINSMKTDNLVVLKAGVIIAKMEPQGSITNGPMQWLLGVKRNLVKQAQTGNVLSISPEEDIETLNMQNLDGAYGMARTNILKNLATAADMPARLLENETMSTGLADGTEDAKAIAQYIDRFRIEMDPIYEFFDNIVQYRAWNPDFYQTIQADFPEEFGSVPYNEAFFDWRNSFVAEWPSLLTEPESEKAKSDDIKLKGIVTFVDALKEKLDPKNFATLVEWAQDNINENKVMFPIPLALDIETLAEYEPPVEEPTAATSKQDSVVRLRR